MNTLKFGNGEWYGKKDTILAYNDENSNFKPLPFSFDRDTLATRVNKQGLIETVGSGEPRIDYKDDSKGALKLEPTRTNSLLQSNQFDTTWLKSSGVTITSEQAISPDGNNNGWKFEKTAASYKSIGQGYTSSSETTFSIFAKKGTLSIITLFANISGGTNLYQRFDLENGTLSSGSGMSNSNIEDYGNGWYRCSSTFTNANVTSLDFFAEFAETNEGYIYIYGGQAESNSSYATSIIPTSGGAVTRVAETAYQKSVTQVIGQSEGTMYIEFVPKDISATQILYQIRSSSGTIGQTDIRLTGGNISTLSNDGGSGQFNMGSTPYLIGTTYKVAVRYKLNNSKIYINGASVGSDTLCSFTGSSLDQVSFGENLTSFIPSANIIDARLYNNGLTDQELIALTTI